MRHSARRKRNCPNLLSNSWHTLKHRFHIEHSQDINLGMYRVPRLAFDPKLHRYLSPSLRDFLHKLWQYISCNFSAFTARWIGRERAGEILPFQRSSQLTTGGKSNGKLPIKKLHPGRRRRRLVPVKSPALVRCFDSHRYMLSTFQILKCMPVSTFCSITEALKQSRNLQVK